MYELQRDGDAHPTIELDLMRRGSTVYRQSHGGEGRRCGAQEGDLFQRAF